MNYHFTKPTKTQEALAKAFTSAALGSTLDVLAKAAIPFLEAPLWRETKNALLLALDDAGATLPETYQNQLVPLKTKRDEHKKSQKAGIKSGQEEKKKKEQEEKHVVENVAQAMPKVAAVPSAAAPVMVIPHAVQIEAQAEATSPLPDVPRVIGVANIRDDQPAEPRVDAKAPATVNRAAPPPVLLRPAPRAQGALLSGDVLTNLNCLKGNSDE